MRIVTYNEFITNWYPDPHGILSYDEKFNLSFTNLCKLIHAGSSGPTYVRLLGGPRDGTIAKINYDNNPHLCTEAEFYAFKADRSLMAHKSQYYRYWVDTTSTYERFVEQIYYYALTFDLEFDNGKIITPSSFSHYYDVDDPDSRTFEWLVDYQGPTVFKFTRRNKNDIVEIKSSFKDNLGQIVEVGDFVAYSRSNNLSVGKVSKLSRNGRSIYVNDYEDGNEVLIANSYRCILIDDKTKTRAMMKRLTQ